MALGLVSEITIMTGSELRADLALLGVTVYYVVQFRLYIAILRISWSAKSARIESVHMMERHMFFCLRSKQKRNL